MFYFISVSKVLPLLCDCKNVIVIAGKYKIKAALVRKAALNSLKTTGLLFV